eukprot:1961050-Rhodomonas_salina.1
MSTVQYSRSCSGRLQRSHPRSVSTPDDRCQSVHSIQLGRMLPDKPSAEVHNVSLCGNDAQKPSQQPIALHHSTYEESVSHVHRHRHERAARKTDYADLQSKDAKESG